MDASETPFVKGIVSRRTVVYSRPWPHACFTYGIHLLPRPHPRDELTLPRFGVQPIRSPHAPKAIEGSPTNSRVPNTVRHLGTSSLTQDTTLCRASSWEVVPQGICSSIRLVRVSLKWFSVELVPKKKLVLTTTQLFYIALPRPSKSR